MPHKKGHQLTAAQKKAGLKLVKKGAKSKPVRKAWKKTKMRVIKKAGRVGGAAGKPYRGAIKKSAKSKPVKRAVKRAVKKGKKALMTRLKKIV